MDIGCLSVRAARDGRVCVLSVRGDLDVSVAGAFTSCAAEAVAWQPERLVLDLGGLGFVDVAGGRALAEVVRMVPPGCPVIVRSAGPLVQRMLELLSVDLARPGRDRRGVPGRAGRGAGRRAGRGEMTG